MSAQIKIGFIGLGSLGTPIAMNLLSSRGLLFVYNRTIEKTAPLVAAGAVACQTVAELAKNCDVIFSIVSDDNALKSISVGDLGMIRHFKKGGIHISMSTVLPQTAAMLSTLHLDQQQHYLAAPVFGRPEAAQARKLNFVVSGAEKIRRTAEPLLKEAGGAGVWDFGDDIASAGAVKLCGNFLIASALEAIGESIALARASGLDATKMWAMFNQTLFNTPLYHNYSNIVLEQKFEPAAFTMKLGLKDIDLVLQQAGKVHKSMPLAKLLQHHMQQLLVSGREDIDWSAVSMAANK